jgi:hypothetical protein
MMYHATRHWAIAGEIVATNFFIRPRVTIMTRFGEEVLVNFHLENADQPKYFSWKSLKTGNTMIILYPERRTFLDMNQGIRQESPNTVMVFEAGLEKVTSEVDSYIIRCTAALNGGGSYKCFACQAEKAKDGSLLKRCARCKATAYCSRECQIGFWKGQHKALCSQSDKLKQLARFDFASFNGFIDWSFPAENSDRGDQSENVEKAIHDLFRRSTGLEPLSKPERFRKVLNTVAAEIFTNFEAGPMQLDLLEGLDRSIKATSASN